MPLPVAGAICWSMPLVMRPQLCPGSVAASFFYAASTLLQCLERVFRSYEERHTGPSSALSDVLIHNFPAPHSDYITQWIDYKAPVEMFDAIGQYDGSCLVDRTAGEVGARCDSEAANIITLNFMHEIVTGKLTVEEARKVYADTVMGYSMGREAPYAERLQFSVPHGDTEDPDQGMGVAPVVRQAAGKVKDMLTGDDS